MSGVKGKSGRKRKTLSRENAMIRLQMLLKGAINTIEETMEGDNLDRLRYEAAIEIKDSVMGKPKNTTEIEGIDKLGVATLIMIQNVIKEEEARYALIEESKQGHNETN